MSVKFTSPANVAHFKRGETVEFKGTVDDDVVKVQLLAEIFL
jgi:hypothetical protein